MSDQYEKVRFRLNPRLVGRVFRLSYETMICFYHCLNPRLVGRVFRLEVKNKHGSDAAS